MNHIATINSTIALQDNFSSVIYNVLNAVSLTVSAMESMQNTMGASFDTTAFDGIHQQLNETTIATQEWEAAIQKTANTADNLSDPFDDVGQRIKHNANEQQRFNQKIEEGANGADNLKNKIASAVGAYAGIAGVKKTIGFINDCTEAYNTQLNAENQLIAVMSNMLDADYVSKFEIETTADTTSAIDEINAIQGSVDAVTIPVTSAGKALQSEFDSIIKKASEIQSKGIYGDEVMISGAAEFATYFTDTDAIEMMMDTLSNYAMGMSGGGEIDSTAMTDYATGLGKIMTGSYDAMTKKGFEFTDAQKAIIEGTATQQQIVATLGEEYRHASEDMQAAAAISQVIDESWGGLYETMSNTPEGKIIQLTNVAGDLQEMIGGQLYPYVMLFVDVIQNNWPVIESVAMGIVSGLQKVMVALSWIANGAINVASFFVDNWSWISPIIWGIVAALGAYNAALIVHKGIVLAATVTKGFQTIAEYHHAKSVMATLAANNAETAAILSKAAAEGADLLTLKELIIAEKLNALTIPAETAAILSKAAAEGADTAALLTKIAAENLDTGALSAETVATVAQTAATTAATTATAAATVAQAGFNTALLACPLTWIVLAIIAVIAIIYAVIGAINKAKGTTISATGVIFGSIAWLGAAILNICIGVINAIIQVIWSLFVEPFLGICEWIMNIVYGGFDSFGGAVANLIGQIISWFLSLGKVVTTIIDAIFGTDWTGGLSSLQSKVTAWGTNDKAIKFERDRTPQISRISYSDAYNWGYGLGEKLDSKVSSMFKSKDIDVGYDLDKLTSYEALGNNVSDIAGNTGSIADSLEITSEDLKYLRDIAEKEVVNRFTTAEIRVEMNNNNNISSDMDLDGVVDYLATGVEEAMEKAAEGVHA